MKHKSNALTCYKNYKAWAETQHNAKLKWLQSDWGGEYLSTEFDQHLKLKGTIQSLIVHDTPEHNGVAERLNCTLIEHVWAIVKLLRSLSNCQDPVWSKINPLPLPQLCSDILRDSNTMLTKPPNSEHPPRPLTHYHCSPRTPNDLREPQSHSCLHLSSSFCLCPLELWSRFHVPVSVFTFPFLIY